MKTDVSIALDAQWSWADHGKCVGDTDLFYNNEDEPRAVRRRKEEKAKRLCESCPVRVDCRRHAMSHRELYGVWGGLSESERHRLAGRVRTG